MNYRKKELLVLASVVVIASFSIFLVLAALAYYCYISNKVSRSLKDRRTCGTEYEEGKTSDCSNFQVTNNKGLHIFTFKQLHSATGGFAPCNLIGNGGFGCVYRGLLQDGRKVTIKLVDVLSKEVEDEFRTEVELLSQLRSPYLLALLGYCHDSNHRLLVFDNAVDGTVYQHLHPNGCADFSKLDWETRIRIALEAAKGLEFLHEHVHPPVIHRDFKSGNILLDENLHAKVSDFGIARLGPEKSCGHVSTRVLGTHGYVAPEYASTGHLTIKSDVYSYGVILLELLTGRLPVDMSRPPGEGILVSWAVPRLTEREKVGEMIDPSMGGDYSLKEAVQVAAIAAVCVQPEADYRPLMVDVVQSLLPLVVSHGKCNSALRSPDSPSESMEDGVMPTRAR